MNLGRMFDMAHEMSEKFISYVKWVRTEGVEISDDRLLYLYEAKFIAEYIFAYFNYKETISYPSRGEPIGYINWDSDRDELVEAIEALLKFNYPAYDIVWA